MMNAPDQSREAVFASEEFNRRTMEAMPGGIVHVAADGTIKHANAEALRILGLSYDALTSKYTSEFEAETIREDGSAFPASDYPASLALSTGEASGPVTIGVRRPDGKISWAVFSAIPMHDREGRLSGAVVTFLDITARRLTEQKLRDSEALLSSIVDSVPGFLLTMDLTGRILFLNRRGPGIAQHDLEGHLLSEFCQQADRERLQVALELCISSQSAQTLELRANPSIGGGLYRSVLAPRLQGGKVVGTTFHASDITQQREMEGRLMLSDRLAAIGTLAAGVAHEVNNPLTFIMAHIDSLQRDIGTTSASASRRLSEILDGAERIRDVVRDLTSFAHRDDGAAVPVQLSNTLDRSLRMAQTEIRHRAHVVRNYGDVPAVRGRPGRIGQVFLNILINAAHAIPLGHAPENQIRISTRLLDGDLVRTSIQDTGAGIPQHLIGGIFDPFVTSKSMGEGSGLGLYISHNIVRSLGGAIWVESELGKGSTFHIDLPVFTRTASQPPAERARISTPSLGRMRVLVVDDEPSIRSFVELLLADHHEVISVASGRDAIESLELRAFDVIVCDLIMPSLTGMDVYDYARAKRPELAPRFVFMTGAAFTDRATELVTTTKQPVLRKPFAASELFAAIGSVAAQAEHVPGPLHAMLDE